MLVQWFLLLLAVSYRVYRVKFIDNFRHTVIRLDVDAGALHNTATSIWQFPDSLFMQKVWGRDYHIRSQAGLTDM